MSETPRMLNLGISLSSGEIDTLFFGSDEESNAESFQVDAEVFATGRTCVIGSSGCIPEDEFFYTKNGVVKVSEIYPGMPSHSGYVSNIEKKKDRIYKVVLHGNGRGLVEFVASGEHPILVSLPCHRGLIRGKIPRGGDHFGHKYHEHQRWITAKELFDKQYKSAYGRVADSDILDVNTISIGKELAKLLGYLMSDGTWSQNQSIKFTNVRNDILQDVERLANNFGLITKRYAKGNAYEIAITHPNGHNRYGSRLLLDNVTNLEIANHSDTFGKLQLLERDELIEFLRGFFNGDGSLRFIPGGKRNRPVMQMTFYVGVSKRQAVELQFMLWRLRIHSSIVCGSRKTSKKASWEVGITQSSIKPAAKLLRDIKYPEIFDKVLSFPDPPMKNNLGVARCSDRNWIRIKKVEELGEATVVGWDNNPDHQIISYGGLVTHNSGKSYTVGVLCEELCKAKVPFAIIDVEGEYSGLKEKFEAIWVGDDSRSDLRWSKKVDLKQLARYAPDSPPIILDLSEASRPKEKTDEFLINLYMEITKRRTPYLVIVEEADRFSPQSSNERLPIIDEIARRGRKRGLGLMLCTQRPSLVDKNILSQCSNQLIGRLVIKNDLNSVSQFFSGRDPLKALTSLKPGEFFALGGLVQEPKKVKLRIRETGHGGTTPRLNSVGIRPSVEKVLESVEGRVATPSVSIALPKQKLIRSLPASPKSQALEVSIESEVVPKQEAPQQSTEVELLPMEDFLDWDRSRKDNEILGFAPLIDREAVPRLVKLQKSYKLFGQKENVTRVGVAFRPLLELGVRIRSGVLKKKFETRYFFMDGVSGKLVYISDRLNFRTGIERLLGLDEGQIEVLKQLRPDKDLSLIEAAGVVNITEEEARYLLRRLEAKRLVRSTKLGRTKMYRRLTDVPKIELGSEPLLKLNELDTSSGFRLAKLKIREDDVREVVKGMWEGADLESFRQVYYPVYLAELLLKRKKRYLWIDGRTGKEIEF